MKYCKLNPPDALNQHNGPKTHKIKLFQSKVRSVQGCSFTSAFQISLLSIGRADCRTHNVLSLLSISQPGGYEMCWVQAVSHLLSIWETQHWLFKAPGSQASHIFFMKPLSIQLPWRLRRQSLPATQETWVRDLGSTPELGRSPGKGNGNPLQYSCLENPMDGGAWRATVHGVPKSRT